MVWLFSAAIIAGVYRSLSLLVIVTGVALARAVVCRAWHAWLALLLAAAGGAVGWTAIERADADRSVFLRTAERANGQKVRLRGWVASFPQSGGYGSTFALATVLDVRPMRVWVRAGCFDLCYGDSLQVDARFATTSRVPSAFLTSRGVAGEARVRFEDVRRTDGERGCPLMRHLLWPMHRSARTHLARMLGGEAALPVGLLLGERGSLDRPAYEAVRVLGIAHLLALSGMHLTMIAALAVFATYWTPRRRAAVVALALSLYVGVVGDVDSLTRAYTMALLILAARALNRPPRPIDALGKALFLMLLASPVAILSVGLQLSFAATLAVFLALDRMPVALRRAPAPARPAWSRALVRCAQSVAAAFWVSVAVEVFIAPLQLHHFGRISMVGPLATVVFLLPVTILQVIALAASFGAAGADGALAAALTWASSTTRAAIVTAGSIAPDPVAFSRPHAGIYYAAALIACAFPKRKLAWGIAVAGIALSFAVGSK